MKSLSSQFEGLGGRDGFNASVRHIQRSIDAIDRMKGGENLADIVGQLVDEKALAKEDSLPFVTMILRDKFKYQPVSANLPSVAADLASIAGEVRKWNGVDLVAVYSHPDLGVIVVNPKSSESISRIDRLSRFELLVVWAGCFDKAGDADTLKDAARAVIDLFSGRSAKAKPAFLKGSCVYHEPKKAAEPKPAGRKAKAAAPKAAGRRGRPAKGSAPAMPSWTPSQDAPAAAAVPAAPVKPAVQAERAVKPGAHMTPLYSVVVTNELFHNENVEAWKRIIASYNAKYPDLQVMVYYDGERIADINALFKWGKVKHGSTIQFAVVGDEIQGVSKLQRYLAQGASPQFAAFIRGNVTSVLPLF